MLVCVLKSPQWSRSAVQSKLARDMVPPCLDLSRMAMHPALILPLPSRRHSGSPSKISICCWIGSPSAAKASLGLSLCPTVRTVDSSVNPCPRSEWTRTFSTRRQRRHKRDATQVAITPHLHSCGENVEVTCRASCTQTGLQLETTCTKPQAKDLLTTSASVGKAAASTACAGGDPSGIQGLSAHYQALLRSWRTTPFVKHQIVRRPAPNSTSNWAANVNTSHM